MCVTNVYVDRYPDGREVEFRQTSICQYGQPGRPCQKLSILENPVRNIQFGEPTTQLILTQPIFPATPPRSSGGSRHRHSAGDSSSEEGRRHRKLPILKPHRTHRKERIIIVDSPPTPRTPPQVYNQVFTAPNSPIVPPRIIDERRPRPIIVDERPLHRISRAPSVGAVVVERLPRRSLSQTRGSRVLWDSPSTSHTSFDLRAELDREREREERADRERRRRALEREELEAEREESRRRAERMRVLDDEIRRRPAVPVPPAPLRQRSYLRPVIDQSDALQGMLGGLRIDDRLGERVIVDAAAERRRLEDRDRVIRQRLEEDEEEAMRQRLRERQLPRRRFSVGPGRRRHRIVYDDGVYRFE
jgi:hypothetical protein